MQFFAIPRLDPGFEGIHLVWSWPDTLPLSLHGYDLQRIEARELRWAERCETIGRAVMDRLMGSTEYAAPLGPLRLRRKVTVSKILDESLHGAALPASDHPQGFGSATRADVHAVLSAAAWRSHTAAIIVDEEIDEYIQELTLPADRVTVLATATSTLAIALSAGKAVAVGSSGSAPVGIELLAPAIDTVLVYVLAARSIQICAYDHPRDQDEQWQHVPLLVSTLTLPIHECNLALVSPAMEFAEAKSRLIGNETLSPADFERMAATLRATAGTPILGRSGERICLTRADTTQTYEEMPFVTQLSAMTLHPKIRRVLGFGFADRKGLVPGSSYVYRLTGRFEAADLHDRIYDVQRLPSTTVLPAGFSIRDLSLRFQTPPRIVLAPTPPSADLTAASRRGIEIRTQQDGSSWLLPSLDNWTVVLTLPTPVSDLVVEVAAGHSFTYAAGLPWIFGNPAPTPLPPGPTAHLHFPAPVQELRLAGQGVLFALRIPSGATGIEEVRAYAGPIVYAAQPLPAAPLILSADTLQQPPATLTGSIDESTTVSPRPPLGFRLNWLPVPTSGIHIWPDDLDAAPPLDALAYMIDHRPVQPPAGFGPWEPISGDDNLTLGSRDTTAPDARLVYGCDLDELFPAVRKRKAGSGYALHLSDVFSQDDPTMARPRPPQPLGSYHQYEIRAVDAVGRRSDTPTLSNIARLEKHIPPPLPVGPQPPPSLDANGHLTRPGGVRARAIVRDAPGLTPSDVALLGAHHNAVLLEWGWRPQERNADPTTAEFRVYLTRPLDVIEASITAVSTAGSTWSLTATTNLPLVVNELIGLWINSNAYPFQVTSNTAGTTVTLVISPSVVDPTRQPVLGAVTFGRKLAPEHQRPRGWDSRVVAIPLTATDENYQYLWYDLLTLTEGHPKDNVWVGVSSADAQPYIPDERTTGPNANRPGNESGIVPCQVAARYRGRPVFTLPPPIGDVPELLTDEPTGRQVLASLNLNALLAGALPVGSNVALLRCSADQVFARVSVHNGNVIFTHADGTEQTIPFPNPGDHAAVLSLLNNDNPQRLANRYLLYILTTATDSLSLFERISGDLDTVGEVADRLAPKPARYFYAVQAADSLGHLSEGAGILPVVVRVPSTAPAKKPLRKSLSTTDTSLTLTVTVGDDWETTSLLLFFTATPPGMQPPPQGEAELLRIPNRHDLYPLNGMRLLTTDGQLHPPLLNKLLSDADVSLAPDGTRSVALSVSALKGSWMTVWCFALTRDNVPGPVCGPFSTGVGS